MSQEKVYYILKDLGGTATTSEIIKAVKEKYPKDSLHTYVRSRLDALEKYHVLKLESRGKENMWTIIGKF
jgi:Fe2+ or Zn2+ uptake regulation protein